MVDFSLIAAALTACVKAGGAVMRVYEGEFAVEHKSDQSPLTLADRRAHDIIAADLADTGLPLLSEEGRDIPYAQRRAWELFWLVDPLDGTKEFVKRNDEFTVNIALIQNGQPVLGTIYVPAQQRLYFGARGLGAYRIEATDFLDDLARSRVTSPDLLQAPARALPVETTRGSALVIVGSRSHLTQEVQDFVAAKRASHGAVEFVSAGSSLKICRVAEGSADIYPRLGPTMEWDIAAGQAIAENAGARFYCFETQARMRYNKENLTNPWFVVERA